MKLSDFRIFLNFLIVTIVVAIAGCAIRPLPDNVTRERTYDIVQRIRCEVRDALRSYIRGALIKFGRSDLANRLRADPALFREFDENIRAELPLELQNILNRYDHGAIGYEFTFDIEENNTLDGGLSIGSLLTRGLFSVSANATADKSRKNNRNFIIVDNMESLARFLDEDNLGNPICGYEPDAPNYKYPIAGSLGLDEFVGTFFNLYEFGSLSTKQSTPSIFADTLEFITTVSGDVGGTLTLSPVRGSGVQFTGADAKYSAKRVDNHKLVLTITLPPEVDSRGLPLTLTEQNARARALARGELERQRIIALDTETSLLRRNLLETFVDQ